MIGLRQKVISAVVLVAIALLAIQPAVAQSNTVLDRSEAIAAAMEAARSEAGKQSRSEGPNSTDRSTASLVSTMLQGLALCLGIFFVGFHFYKRFALKSGVNGRRSLELIDRIPVSAKTHLILVQVEGQKKLFTVGSERVTALDARDLNEKRRGQTSAPIELVCESELKMSA